MNCTSVDYMIVSATILIFATVLKTQVLVGYILNVWGLHKNVNFSVAFFFKPR